MNVLPTEVPGVLVLEPRVFADPRGFFLECYQRDRYRAAGLELDFVQDNHSCSRRGTLRGLHYQLPYPQGKLVWVLRGEILDVAVDLRRDSPSFGRWVSRRLNDENRRQMYVPPGCAHGFCVLSDMAEVFYKCTELYHPECEHVLRWDDPDVGIDWPVQQPVLSPRDQRGGLLHDVPHYEEGWGRAAK